MNIEANSKMINTNKNGEWLEITIPSEWEELTTEQLFSNIWNAPKKQTHLLRMNKEVKVNDQPANWTRKLNPGEILALRIFTSEKHDFIPKKMKLDILFEDDHVLVVNKPAGMDTHPNAPIETNTLTNGVAFYLQEKGESGRLKHVHRLDRDTSGTVLFAKYSFIGAILDKMLEKREIKRTYLAVLKGIIKDDKGAINSPIGRDRHHSTRRRVSQGGQSAVTHYKTVSRDFHNRTTAVKCKLETGRTHQIRVHFSHIGHPLVGDSLYGGSKEMKRQALHAAEIEFKHPFTLDTISCQAEPPADFKDVFPGNSKNTAR